MFLMTSTKFDCLKKSGSRKKIGEDSVSLPESLNVPGFQYRTGDGQMITFE